ncbi:MAG: ABC transporter permease subunit, partial [Clostridia bacterium]|nr:ABC transporter permease subunit [Clostridia bacterium]
MKAVYKKEMRSYLTSPIGYVFVGIYLLLAGAVFCYSTLFSMTADTSTYFTVMMLLQAVLLPLLTMKSFSEERKQRTEQLLMTAPVSITGFVLGKFLAALTLYGACTLFSSLYFLILFIYGQVKTAVLFGNVVAFLLVGMAFLAIGIFVSALTENQLAAAVGSVGLILLFLCISLLNDLINVYFIRFILSALSIFSRFQGFTQGVFDFS